MSGFDLGRLRSGEVIAGASGVLLLIFMFALKWYAVSGALSQTLANLGRTTSWSGWSGLNHLRWLLLLTILVALALTFFQAARRAPAVPVTLSMILTVLAALSVLALIYRVLINPPGSGTFVDQQPGAYLGLLATIGVAYGGYRSMREEGGSELGAREIPTVRIGPPTGS